MLLTAWGLPSLYTVTKYTATTASTTHEALKLETQLGFASNMAANSKLIGLHHSFTGPALSADMTEIVGIQNDITLTGQTITSYIGYRSQILAPDTTFTNIYEMLLNGGTGTATHWWGLYQADPDGKNYMAGRLMIGTTTGLAALSVNGGVHVGGDSDPGDNNLLVDGGITADTLSLTTIGDVATALGGLTTALGGLTTDITARATKTTAAWSKTVGAGGDYATFAAAFAAVPDLIAHGVTITIAKGTTLTEQVTIVNKHGLTAEAGIVVQAAKYYPTTVGPVPVADGADATHLTDASVFVTDDEYNDCWVLIVAGTGVDNGYVKITDTDAATGKITVASWPGTQPDDTSCYIIVGALIDAEASRTTCFYASANTCPVVVLGVGVTRATQRGFYVVGCTSTVFYSCGTYDNAISGLYAVRNAYVRFLYGGAVANNTSNGAYDGGFYLTAVAHGYIYGNGISGNNVQGISAILGSILQAGNNFGTGNGTWGAYARLSAQIDCYGTECSGSSGNHSNGTGDGSLVY